MSIPKWFPIPHLPFVKRLNCVLESYLQNSAESAAPMHSRVWKFFFRSNSLNVNIFFCLYIMFFFLISLCAGQIRADIFFRLTPKFSVLRKHNQVFISVTQSLRDHLKRNSHIIFLCHNTMWRESDPHKGLVKWMPVNFLLFSKFPFVALPEGFPKEQVYISKEICLYLVRA